MLSIKELLNYVDYGSVLLAQRNWPVKQEKKKTSERNPSTLGNLITDRGSVSGHQQEEEPVSKMLGWLVSIGGKKHK